MFHPLVEPSESDTPSDPIDCCLTESIDRRNRMSQIAFDSPFNQMNLPRSNIAQMIPGLIEEAESFSSLVNTTCC